MMAVRLWLVVGVGGKFMAGRGGHGWSWIVARFNNTNSEYLRGYQYQGYTRFAYFCKSDRVPNVRQDAIMDEF